MTPTGSRSSTGSALWGFALWSLSMICGGVWGVVAWGAWFLWDPKVVWSVILWFHSATFVHLRLTPSLASVAPGCGRRWPLAGLRLRAGGLRGHLLLLRGSSHAFG